MLQRPACPHCHAPMKRQSWGFVDWVAYAWALEAVFWVVAAVGFIVLSALHAQSYVWVLGVVVFAAMALCTEWWVASYRCAGCDFVATRSEIAGRLDGRRLTLRRPSAAAHR